MIATKNGHEEVVKYLESKGADIHFQKKVRQSTPT